MVRQKSTTAKFVEMLLGIMTVHLPICIMLHLNIMLACHYCDFCSPSFATLKKHVSDKHAGLPVQVAPPSGEQKFEATVTLPQ